MAVKPDVIPVPVPAPEPMVVASSHNTSPSASLPPLTPVSIPDSSPAMTPARITSISSRRCNRRRSSSLCPDTEYRQSFRRQGFRPFVGGASGMTPPAAAAGRPSRRLEQQLMTRSATTEPTIDVPDSSSIRRSASACHPRGVYGESEYKSSFRTFDEYVYVDDVQRFVCRSPDQPDSGDCTHRSLTWLDQVRERHSSAVSFHKRSMCGSSGSESLVRVYRDATPGRREDRALVALSLATHASVARDKRQERQPVSGGSRKRQPLTTSRIQSAATNGRQSAATKQKADHHKKGKRETYN